MHSAFCYRRQKGFTLIELMIVVAIIGILSAIAIPAYHHYTLKSEATVGISTTNALTTNIELYIQENGQFPSQEDMAELGATSTMSPLGSLTLKPDEQSAEQGELIFEFTDASSLKGKKVIWTRYKQAGWLCIQNAYDGIRGCPIGHVE
jgi:type IV pilus assembly protein PilA